MLLWYPREANSQERVWVEVSGIREYAGEQSEETETGEAIQAGMQYCKPTLKRVGLVLLWYPREANSQERVWVEVSGRWEKYLLFSFFTYNYYKIELLYNFKLLYL